MVPAPARPLSALWAAPAEGSEAFWEQFAGAYLGLQARLESVLDPYGVLLSEFKAIGHCVAAPRPLRELGRLLGLSPAAMTDMARRLAQRGLAVRQPHPRDRRSFVLAPTARGRALHRQARVQFRAQIAEALGRLAPDDRRALIRGLGALRERLEEAHADGPY